MLYYHEDPRIREQEWGNFQEPSQMDAIMVERRKIGAFFYRFPTGERWVCKVRVERTTWWKFVGVSSTKKYSHTQNALGTRLTKKSWNTISFILTLRSTLTNSHTATSLTCGEYLLECLTISCRKAGLWPSHQFSSQCVNHGITSYVCNTNLQGHLLSLTNASISLLL